MLSGRLAKTNRLGRHHSFPFQRLTGPGFGLSSSFCSLVQQLTVNQFSRPWVKTILQFNLVENLDLAASFRSTKGSCYIFPCTNAAPENPEPCVKYVSCRIAISLIVQGLRIQHVITSVPDQTLYIPLMCDSHDVATVTISRLGHRCARSSNNFRSVAPE